MTTDPTPAAARAFPRTWDAEWFAFGHVFDLNTAEEIASRLGAFDDLVAALVDPDGDVPFD